MVDTSSVRKPAGLIYYATLGSMPIYVSLWSCYKSFETGTRATLEETLSRTTAAVDPPYSAATIPVFIALLAAEALVLKKRRHNDGAWRANDALSSVFAGIIREFAYLFLWPLTVFPMLYLRERVKLLELRDDSLAHWLLAFVLVDLLYYAFHRAAHEYNIFWIGHHVHHSSECFNLTTALRQSAIQATFRWMFFIPAAPFVSFGMYQRHLNINAVFQFFIHTEVVGTLPAAVEYVFNTPSHHRVHHGSQERYIDKNYGGTLICFDRLFSTFEPEVEPPVYGVTVPLGTLDPVWAQVAQLAECVQVTLRTPKWTDKVRVWIDHGPSFNHRELRKERGDNGLQHCPSREPPTKVSHGAKEASPGALVYAYANALASIIVGSAVILSAKTTEDSRVIALGIAATVMSMCVSTAVLTQRPWASSFDIGVRLPMVLFAAMESNIARGFCSDKKRTACIGAGVFFIALLALAVRARRPGAKDVRMIS